MTNVNSIDLLQLNGVSLSKKVILKSIGINNIADLLAFDVKVSLKNAGISIAYVKKLKLLATARIESKIFKLKPFILNTANVLYYDIETDLEPSYAYKKVWSIAVFNGVDYVNFFAKTWHHEKEMLGSFLSFIANNSTCNLMCYSGAGFDKNVIIAALKRNNLDYNYFENMHHSDLCSILKTNYILPTKSYGLKEVGKYMQYKFYNEDMDGMYVAITYMQAQIYRKEIPKEIFKYIEDDVLAMHHIVNYINEGINCKDIF